MECTRAANADASDVSHPEYSRNEMFAPRARISLSHSNRTLIVFLVSCAVLSRFAGLSFSRIHVHLDRRAWVGGETSRRRRESHFR